jgi:hypothetical protein
MGCSVVRFGFYAGGLNASPLASTAQAIRAFFAAIAITAFPSVLGEIDANVQNAHDFPFRMS